MASDEVQWVRSSEPVHVRARLWRMVRAPAVDGEPHWLGASGSRAECDRNTVRTRCLFVPADDAGVIVAARGATVLFAISARDGAGAAASETSWRSAPWGRFVRVVAPAQSSVSARVVTVERAVRSGKGLLREARASDAARIYTLSGHAFWVAGRREAVARLDVSVTGSATTRLPLAVVKASPLVPLEISPSPEERVDGDVRSRGALVEGVTVVVARFLELPPGKTAEEERPMELLGETKTDSAGRFAFRGLARERHEIIAMHPSRGRARAVALAPTHSRLALEPRAVVRGRVMRAGVPAGAASVSILPSFDAIAEARNPILLVSESVRTGLDGRFEALLPDAGRVVLTVVHDAAIARVDLGDVAAVPAVLDIGDIRLEPPLEFALLADLPATCTIQAAGPFGDPGMTLVAATPAGAGRWLWRAPLPGRWFFEASCGGRDVGLETPIVQIDRGASRPIMLRLRR